MNAVVVGDEDAHRAKLALQLRWLNAVKISLVHNPTAGGGEDVDDIVRLLTDAGHEVRHASSKGDWKSLLQDPGDLLVAAGGDGTVRKVALAAADDGLRFAVIPIGTANNVAKTLGLLGDARDLVASWSDDPPPERPFDIGEVVVAGRTDRFIESVGGGLVAEVIARAHEIEEVQVVGRETDRALDLLARTLREARPQPWRVTADGRDHSGDYLAVEVMNTRFVGVNVPFAPDADPSDGRLDLVMVTEADREPILEYLERRLHLSSGEMPALRSESVTKVALEPPAGVRLHLDDEIWPG